MVDASRVEYMSNESPHPMHQDSIQFIFIAPLQDNRAFENAGLSDAEQGREMDSSPWNTDVIM